MSTYRICTGCGTVYDNSIDCARATVGCGCREPQNTITPEQFKAVCEGNEELRRELQHNGAAR